MKVGLGTQSILWSTAAVFTPIRKRRGTATVYVVTAFASAASISLIPLDLLDTPCRSHASPSCDSAEICTFDFRFERAGGHQITPPWQHAAINAAVRQSPPSVDAVNARFWSPASATLLQRTAQSADSPDGFLLQGQNRMRPATAVSIPNVAWTRNDEIAARRR